MYWGKGKYNPIISIIHHFLNVVEENIPEYNPDTHSEKIGVVLTMRDYVQALHLDIYRLNEKENLSWIYHSPCAMRDPGFTSGRMVRVARIRFL